MLNFLKGYGLGNDCVIFKDVDYDIIEKNAKLIADRKYGIGCDQVICVNQNYVKFWNADGSYASFCGNGSRVIALMLEDIDVSFMTDAGIVKAKKNFGTVKLRYPKKPIIKSINETKDEYEIDIGNNQIILFGDRLLLDWKKITKEYDASKFNIMYLSYSDGWFMDIYERGVGENDSCGSGAAAAAVAIAHKFGHTEDIAIQMKGGCLTMSVDTNGFVYQSGTSKIVFSGSTDLLKPSFNMLYKSGTI